MTDGIIQTIFKKYRKISYGDCASETDVDELLVQLQNEIIAEISRHECGCHYPWGCHYDTCKNAVIGDVGQ